jgi:hypothetical protein
MSHVVVDRFEFWTRSFVDHFLSHIYVPMVLTRHPVMLSCSRAEFGPS